MNSGNKLQKPIAWLTAESLRSLEKSESGKATVPVHRASSCKSNIPLYAEPKTRDWVGLDEEVIMDLFEFHVMKKQTLMGFYNAVEDKLKENNA